MEEPNLPKNLKDILEELIQGLKKVYADTLVCVILYGSAASGEFIDRHSNLNLLVVLKDTSLQNLKKASGFINRRKFAFVHPLFLTEEYIKSSSDVFPIEFLDMKENYRLLYGRDILAGVAIDTRNLRFQCEQELKSKLIVLRQMYLRRNKDSAGLRALLFKSFNSVMHILRNVLRLKGKEPAYLKQDILQDVAANFAINKAYGRR